MGCVTELSAVFAASSPVSSIGLEQIGDVMVYSSSHMSQIRVHGAPKSIKGRTEAVGGPVDEKRVLDAMDSTVTSDTLDPCP